MKLVISLGLLAACSFPTPSEQYACRTTKDCTGDRVCTQGYCVLGSEADIDAPIQLDTSPAIDCTTFPARHFDACMIPPPTGDFSLMTPGIYTLDATTGSVLAPGGSSSLPATTLVASGRVVSVSSVKIGPGVTLRVIGGQPLILASWGTIEIAGTIDASSTGPTSLGAGANPAGCATHAAVMGQSAGGGAGGGGSGGFQATGGRGGIGDNGNGGLGGTPISVPLLLGGCAGAIGGTGSSVPGEGGAGGGALQLTARISISIASTGTIHAGGGGGKPAGPSGNGGGGGAGGSGGMIGLEAPMLDIAAGGVLAANGGAGGEGGGNMGTGGTGQAGQPSAVRAQCPDSGSGGNGGIGSGGLVLAGGGGGNDTSGGGGAGGSAGFITLKATIQNIDALAIISPAAIAIP
ncbi:hypothetical protein BH11MYX3_BH11MYX3_29730 [soil metagenome]